MSAAVESRAAWGLGQAAAPGNVWPAFTQGSRAQNRRLSGLAA
ncbi:hypothetical protein VSH64_38140 [Amycolatopsis rhabdoformis]|uniref:Uncharacterized protein n=1 Tax=Amycolatopsis rhabdoformis TaxID=1448059 RepID=A0ABZ1I2K4_9PSEU|nr:hypothetical protein [Amycolatopsis rhabdoformis]WSE28606.1 hypothetical protein VSH64_38140 [Amycolatopsis rhabdoformis]